VDGGQLHRLGKRLLELSRATTTQAGDPSLTPGELAVLEDALTHPGSSVGQIQARTSFAQSHVSASIARLKQRGLVQTTADPADGRRTSVRVSEDARRAITTRAGRRIDHAIADAVDDPDQARRVIVLLEELAQLLA